MNKIVKTLLVVTVILGAFAFTTPVKKKINIKESTIVWKGKKIIGASHTGTLKLKSGYFEMENDVLLGGNFVVDMTSLTVTGMDEKYGKKLEGHLRSDDFFGIEQHPTASLIFNNISKNDQGYEVTGEITIKGITESITFNLKMENNVTTLHLDIDRSKFNVRYGSGSFFDDLGDNMISDIIELDITLIF